MGQLDDYKIVKSSLENMIKDFNKHSKEGIKLTDKIPVKRIREYSKWYLEKMTPDYAYTNTIRRGSTVRVKFSPMKVTHYTKEYLFERDRAIPMRSEGEVRGYTKENGTIVEFSKGNPDAWKTGWDGLGAFWKRGSKLIGGYHKSELQLLPAISPIQKKGFEFKMNSMIESMKPYGVVESKGK